MSMMMMMCSGVHLHQRVLPEVQPDGLNAAQQAAVEAGALQTHKHPQFKRDPI